jgi:peptidoglycan/xylan/chitin deacetylase (PgdA/CDA1 family)
MYFSAMSHSLEHQACPPLRVLHFLYHELRPEGSRYSYVLETGEFERHIDLFARIREQVQENKGAALWPEVTFDDGHISNFEHALPILLTRGMKARFFVTAGWTGAKDGYMGWKELRSLLHAGQLIGAHGWSHTLLTHCDDSELRTELRGAKETLEDRLGVAVDTMSLPGGRYNRRVLAACREAGYAQVYTSIPRADHFPPGTMVGRLNVRGDMPVAQIERLLRDQSGALANLERSYQMKAAAKRLLGDKLYEKVWGVLNRKEDEAAVR